MTLIKIEKRIAKLADKKKAQQLQRFFKTGPGQYGEGDIFLGISVPELRKLAKAHLGLSLVDTSLLLKSDIHEKRLLALLILLLKFNKADKPLKKKIYELYLKNTEYINNWDLVDLSAHHIVGAFLFDQDKDMLYFLAKSKILWERRISILATYHFIKKSSFSDTLQIAEILLYDKEDLIHKAVGWMLREVGKKNLANEEIFLKKHYRNMPRTMLRYSIERFSKSKRLKYLHGKI